MRPFRHAALVTCLLIAVPAVTDAQYFSPRDLQSVVDALDVVDLHGRRWTAANFKGRVVLIDFWATWCAPCLAQIPDFKRLREGVSTQEFEVLSISVDSLPKRDFVARLNRQGVTWPQVHDGRALNSRSVRPFGVQALPASLLISDGVIAAENLRGERLIETVHYLLAANRAARARQE